MPSQPFVSVVVCTYNRCKTLHRMLDSFYEQEGLDPRQFELIVVDNNSTDETSGVSSSFSDRPGFRYVFEPRQGLSAARNRGTAEARGDVVAFLDDDVLLERHWLTGLARCFADTDASAVGGRAHLRLEGPQPSWMGPLFRTLLSQVDFGLERKEVPDGYGLWGLNLAFRRDALVAAGGFDERLGRSGSQLLGGEETAALARIVGRGGRCYYEPRAFVEHIIGAERLQWDYFVRLARGNGAARHMSDAPASVAWQTLRVARSATVLVAHTVAKLFDDLFGRDSYAVRCRQWNGELLAEHHRLRWRRLAGSIAETFGGGRVPEKKQERR